MRTPKAIHLFGALALLLAACSSSATEATAPAAPTPPPTSSSAPEVGPTPSATPTSRAGPNAETVRAQSPPATPTASDENALDQMERQQTAKLLDELAVELGLLGVDDEAVGCITSGLRASNLEPDAIESAALDVVILLDSLAAFCDVDLLEHLDD